MSKHVRASGDPALQKTFGAFRISDQDFGFCHPIPKDFICIDNRSPKKKIAQKENRLGLPRVDLGYWKGNFGVHPWFDFKPVLFMIAP